MTGRYPGTPDPEGVYRPVLYVFVIAPSGRVFQTGAIVDSGADRTVIPYELVKALTEEAWDDLGESPPWLGLGGEQDMKVADLSVAWPTATDVFCTEVVVTPAADAPVLLGRADFFRRWAVKFNWQHTPPYPPWFEVQRVSTTPPSEARKRGKRR